VLGTFLAGFVLLQTIGLQTSLYCFGCLNLAIGAVAVYANRRSFAELRALLATAAAPAEAAESKPAPETEPRAAEWRWLLLAAISGCVALGAEIVWIRGFSSLLLSTTYTFSLVLMVYLVGIALGSAAGAKLQPSRFKLAWLFIALALATLTQLALYQECHQLVIRWVQARPAYDLLLLLQGGIVAAVVLPLTLCSGAALPLIVGSYSHGLGRAGRDVGTVYIANTVGAVLGTIAAGFLLLPQVGAMAGSRILAAVALAGALLILGAGAPEKASRRMTASALAGVAVAAAAALLWPAPSRERQAFSPVLLGKRTPADVDPEYLDRVVHLEGGSIGLVKLAHGLSADSAITVDFANSQTALWINGMPNASSRVDQQTQINLAVLPYLYASRIGQCLHVGLGSGITAGAWSALPGAGKTRIVELESSLWELSRLFAPYDFGLHQNQRVEFIADDAISYLELLPPAGLDVIASQPSQLWSKGVGNLFTKEFFRTARQKLKPDGLFAAWVMGYDVRGEVWAIALATLLDEFPHVFAFRILDGGDVIFICSQRPLRFHAERWRKLAAMSGPPGAMREILRLKQPEDLALYALADDQTLRQAVRRTLAAAGAAGERNTMDRPVLEYLYPRWLIADTSNQLLGALQQQRLRTDSTGDRFLMPPGLSGRTPRSEILYELSLLTDVDPIRVLTGTSERELLWQTPSALSPQQLRWSFIASVRQRDLATAQRLWEKVRLQPLDQAQWVAAAYDFAQAIQQPALVAWLNQQLPPVGPDTPLEILLRKLDSLWIPQRAADEYIRTFMAGAPPRRFLVDSIPPAYFQILVEAGSASQALPQVEAYLSGLNDVYHGHLPWVACALADVLSRQGKQQAARRVFPTYADPDSLHPYIKELETRLQLRPQ